ncbi:MAG: MotA/TolQ/ExbB proton channel family protein [Alcanivoracaceae bacterium]|jgi:biopolymer transport protein ExbB|nr:MotA/TolQ/ExbB proton channel family protein [Alcanivoracaceae bacterium]
MGDFLLTNTGELSRYFTMGGFVMLPLVLVAIVLWYALAIRYLSVRPGNMDARRLLRYVREQRPLPDSVPAVAVGLAMAIKQRSTGREELRSRINEAFSGIRLELSRHRSLARSLIAVAPLLGLLGTVDGMIETFDSLAEMALYTQSGGIAGGISRALFTTQMGLAVSIPGLLAGRMIDRREENIRLQLDQIRDLLCTSDEQEQRG